MSEEDAAAAQRAAAERDVSEMDEEPVEAPGNEPEEAAAEDEPEQSEPLPAAADPDASLFEKLGGKAAIAEAVGALFDDLLRDTRIAAFYTAVDLWRQQDATKRFFTEALGGPALTDGLEDAAQKAIFGEPIDPTDDHFDLWLEKLEQAFRTAGVPEPAMFDALMALEKYRGIALGR
jgi:hemoglobin